MTISSQIISDMLSDRSLGLILLPTEQCNFRCTYCYEDFKIGRMKKETVQGIKRLLAQRASELNNLTISWFGGEPLLAKDIITDICSYAKNISEEHHIDKYDSAMTTNGYNLDIVTFSELVDLGVTYYQITLDGLGEVHDSTRISVDKKGTFDKIWRNLLNIRDSNKKATIVLRVHIDPHKVNHINDLIDKIKTEFINDKRFAVRFKAIDRFGGKNDSNIKIIATEEKEQAIKNSIQKLYGERSKEYYDESDYVCYASKPNSLIIRADGSICKCTVALSNPLNQIGKIDEIGKISIDNNKLSFWLRGIYSLDSSILSCPYSAAKVQ